MRRFRTAAVTALLLVPIVAGGFLLQEPQVKATPRLFDQVISLVSTQFVDTMPGGVLFEKAAQGLVRELNDPYSELLTPRETEEFARGTGGRYGGTGMSLRSEQGATVVERVFPHTPAQDGGVLAGDRIIAIDGLATQSWSLTRVSESLRGDPGSKVVVTYLRPGVVEPIRLRFTRAVIHVPAVLYSTILTDSIGYIPLQTFNENAAEEVEAAVRKLESNGARGLVLDMRGNGGGIVDQALAVSSLFLRPGQEIVKVRSRGATPAAHTDEVSRATGKTIAGNIPLVVLVDANSASATEIVAGALQDHDRALIVGQPSFGKGLVQSVFQLNDGYALKLTTGKWFTPSGRSIHRDRRFVDGRLIEEKPDSDETRVRPVFKSDQGRVVYGGGGITPDVMVKDDTLTTREQRFLLSVAPRAQAMQAVLSQYALELKSTVKPGFVMSQEWTAELIKRLKAAGVEIAPSYEDVAPELLSKELEFRVALQAFGDAAAKERELPNDSQLLKAIGLLRQSNSMAQLLNVAGASD